ncbi:MAG: hypothetical protein AAB731_04900 [Patescibacteria group bacterium]
MTNKKPTIAIYSLTCCDGCEFAILDLPEKLLELTKHAEIKRWRLLDENGPPADETYDICFVEGSAVTKENVETLKNLRERSKFLCVLGNCAEFGGIHRIKNWHDKEQLSRYVYKYAETIENPKIQNIDEQVKFDFAIPACPLNGEEFYRIVNEMLAGKHPKIEPRPVCYECQTRGYECILQKGQICLGPLTLGGCEAVCLGSKMPCWSCRGLLPEVKLRPDAYKNLLKFLLERHSKDEIDKAMEVFGVKDEYNKLLAA